MRYTLTFLMLIIGLTVYSQSYIPIGSGIKLYNGSYAGYIGESRTGTLKITHTDSVNFYNGTTVRVSILSTGLRLNGDYLSHPTLFNSFFGTEAGAAITTGAGNVFIGYQTGSATTIGETNVFMGYQSGYKNTEGSGNTFVGFQAGYENTTAIRNTFYGYQSGYSNTGGTNLFVGYRAGYVNIIGTSNTIIGNNAGYNSIGTGNVYVGNSAGYYETADNSFYLHNGLGVTNLATGKSNSLMYGIFDAVPANQTLTVNGVLTVSQPCNLKYETIGITVDGGGGVITTGIKGDYQIPFDGVITGWTLLADQAGNVEAETWVDTYVNYPPTVADDIWITNPALVGVTKNTATGLSIAVTAGNTFRYNIVSATTVTRLTLNIQITRN